MTLTIEIGDIDATTGKRKIIDAYPARVKYRGFNGPDQDSAYRSVADYLDANMESIKSDVFPEQPRLKGLKK